MEYPAKPIVRDLKHLCILILISSVFFSVYLFGAATVLTTRKPVISSLLSPDPVFLAGLLLPSCAGSILLVWEMKKQSRNWKAAFPLGITTGVITLSFAMFSLYEPSSPVLKLFGLSLLAIVIGYAVLPVAASYFFMNGFPGHQGKTEVTFGVFSLLGLSGPLIIITSITLNIVNDLTSVKPARMDIWQFSIIGILVLLLYLLYCLILLPLAGILFIRLGVQFLKTRQLLSSEFTDE